MIKLDKFREIYQVVKKKQYDTLEQLEISIFDNGIPIVLTGYSVILKSKKCDNTIVIQDNNIVITGNNLSIRLNPQITIITGIVECEITLVKTGLQDSSFTFYIEVKESVLEGGV
ncbi:MAG: BppU family phage baseplate upper protein, partial [Clostridium sp.]